MGGVGEEVTQCALLALDLVGHLIEGLRQLAGLAGAFDGDFLVEAAAGDAAGGGGGGLEGPVDGAGEEQADDDGGGETDAAGEEEAGGEVAEDGLAVLYGQGEDDEVGVEALRGFRREGGGEIVEVGAVAGLEAAFDEGAGAGLGEVDLQGLTEEAGLAAGFADDGALGVGEEDADVGVQGDAADGGAGGELTADFEGLEVGSGRGDDGEVDGPTDLPERGGGEPVLIAAEEEEEGDAGDAQSEQNEEGQGKVDAPLEGGEQVGAVAGSARRRLRGAGRRRDCGFEAGAIGRHRR